MPPTFWIGRGQVLSPTTSQVLFVTKLGFLKMSSTFCNIWMSSKLNVSWPLVTSWNVVSFQDGFAPQTSDIYHHMDANVHKRPKFHLEGKPPGTILPQNCLATRAEFYPSSQGVRKMQKSQHFCQNRHIKIFSRLLPPEKNYQECFIGGHIYCRLPRQSHRNFSEIFTARAQETENELIPG